MYHVHSWIHLKFKLRAAKKNMVSIVHQLLTHCFVNADASVNGEETTSTSRCHYIYLLVTNTVYVFCGQDVVSNYSLFNIPWCMYYHVFISLLTEVVKQMKSYGKIFSQW